MAQTIIELLALFLLSRYLWRKHLERLHRKLERIIASEPKGIALDPALLRVRLESVRKDYVAALGEQTRSAARKPRLVSLARRMVCGLGYFRERIPPETQPVVPVHQHG